MLRQISIDGHNDITATIPQLSQMAKNVVKLFKCIDFGTDCLVFIPKIDPDDL
jgi:hypothetical protein